MSVSVSPDSLVPYRFLRVLREDKYDLSVSYDTVSVTGTSLSSTTLFPQLGVPEPPGRSLEPEVGLLVLLREF